MPKAYSVDLRKRVVLALQKKVSQRKVSEVFSVSIESVKRWWKIFQETNELSPKKPKQTRPFKLNYEEVRKFIEQNEDKTLKEIGKEFNVSDVAILKILRKLNITYKKKVLIRGKKGRFESRVFKEIK